VVDELGPKSEAQSVCGRVKTPVMRADPEDAEQPGQPDVDGTAMRQSREEP